MGLARWTRLVLDRSGTAFGALFAGVDGDSLLEDDPVGEFLSHKKDGTFQLGDEEGGEEAQASLEPRVTRAVGGDTEALEPAVADLEQSPEEQELEAEDLGLMQCRAVPASFYATTPTCLTPSQERVTQSALGKGPRATTR